MVDYSGIQLQVLLQFSVFMMIAVQLLQPYTSSKQNLQELQDEIVVLIVCYHVILLSDFVPLSNHPFRVVVGFSLILIVLITILIVLISIGRQIAMDLFGKANTAYLRWKFTRDKSREVSNLAKSMYSLVTSIQEMHRKVDNLESENRGQKLKGRKKKIQRAITKQI